MKRMSTVDQDNACDYIVLFLITQSKTVEFGGAISAQLGKVSRSKYQVPKVYNQSIKTATLIMFINSPVFAWKQK